MLKKILLLVPVMLMTGSLLAKDVVMTILHEQFQESGPDQSTVTVSLSGNRIRTSMDDASNTLIFRGDKQLMWVVDAEKKEYYEVTREAIEKLTASVSPAMEKMKNQMETLPEAQRAMAEEMMKQRMGNMAMQEEAELTYQPTRQQKAIQGYECTRWNVFRNSEKIEELWVTDWNNLAYRQELQTALNALSEFITSLQKAVQQFPMASQISMPLDYNANAELNGIPVSSVHYENGQMTNRSTLQRIESQPLSETLFMPPAGYTRRTMQNQGD